MKRLILIEEIKIDNDIMLSIVVPVYNKEKYIGKCIESILAQTYTDFELIIVDDASTDGSVGICERFASSDERIKIISISKNAGVSAARNMGIDAASGEYIGFVDADDIICPEMYSILIEKATENNADIVMCNLQYISFDGEAGIVTRSALPSEVFLTSDEIKKMMDDIYYGKKTDGAIGTCVNKLYRRKKLIDSGVRFGVGRQRGEDWAFVEQLLKRIDSLYYTDQVLYYYIRVSDSHLLEEFPNDYFDKGVIETIDRWNMIRENNDGYDWSKEYSRFCECYCAFLRYMVQKKGTSAYKEVKKVLSHPAYRQAVSACGHVIPQVRVINFFSRHNMNLFCFLSFYGWNIGRRFAKRRV